MVGVPGGTVGHDAPVLDADVAHLTVDPVGGIVHRAARDPEPCRCSSPRPREPAGRGARASGWRSAGPAGSPGAGAGRRPSGSRARLVNAGDPGVDGDPGGERRVARPRADDDRRHAGQRRSHARRARSPASRRPAPPRSSRRSNSSAPRDVRLVAREAAGEVHGERESGLPGHHGLGAAAVAAAAEGAQRRAGGRVERLRPA